MGPVVASLARMGMGQVLLASVLLGSYALALGQFAGTRGHPVTIATAILAAAGFVALSEPWEAGVILIAFVPVSMCLFAGAAWTLWKMTSGSPGPAVLSAPALLQSAPSQAALGSLLERMRERANGAGRGELGDDGNGYQHTVS
jgi:hypothetical protein